MDLNQQTLRLVEKEKHYTALILNNLVKIDSQKLFCDWGYTSLYHYLTKGLKYSDSEANTRVGVVRLARKENSVISKIAKGSLSLTNAAQANQILRQMQTPNPKKVIKIVENKSTRQAKKDLHESFELKTSRTEKVILDERILKKVDRAREIYGDISAYELLDILLEEKLKTPSQPQRKRSSSQKRTRYIQKSVKYQVYQNQCKNCGSKRNLQYDHIKEYSRGGKNIAENLQVLCANCNLRKEIKRTTSCNDNNFSYALST